MSRAMSCHRGPTAISSASMTRLRNISSAVSASNATTVVEPRSTEMAGALGGELVLEPSQELGFVGQCENAGSRVHTCERIEHMFLLDYRGEGHAVGGAERPSQVPCAVYAGRDEPVPRPRSACRRRIRYRRLAAGALVWVGMDAPARPGSPVL